MRRLVVCLTMVAAALLASPASANNPCVTSGEFQDAVGLPSGTWMSVFHELANTNGFQVRSWTGEQGVWKHQVRQYDTCNTWHNGSFREQFRAPTGTAEWKVEVYIGLSPYSDKRRGS